MAADEIMESVSEVDEKGRGMLGAAAGGATEEAAADAAPVAATAGAGFEVEVGSSDAAAGTRDEVRSEASAFVMPSPLDRSRATYALCSDEERGARARTESLKVVGNRGAGIDCAASSDRWMGERLGLPTSVGGGSGGCCGGSTAI